MQVKLVKVRKGCFRKGCFRKGCFRKGGDPGHTRCCAPAEASGGLSGRSMCVPTLRPHAPHAGHCTPGRLNARPGRRRLLQQVWRGAHHDRRPPLQALSYFLGVAGGLLLTVVH
eukprot:349751-Chlamydomonas_euryale.AAC.6